MASRSEVHRRVRLTEIDRLPGEVRSALFVEPLAQIAIPVEGGTLALPPDLVGVAEADAVPKLGVKTWQDSGRLRLIPEGAPLREAAAARLATLTPPQRLTIPAWADHGEPLFLYLLPFRDLSQTSEVRLLAGPGGTRLYSRCLRGHGAEARVAAAGDDLYGIARRAADALGIGPVIVQCLVEPSGQVSILDINPGLTPAEIAALSAPDRR